MLNSERLEEAWFSYEAVKVWLQAANVLISAPEIKSLAAESWKTSVMKPFRLLRKACRHAGSCLNKGCAERMIVVDGLMTVHRAKCAVKGDTVKMSGETPNNIKLPLA